LSILLLPNCLQTNKYKTNNNISFYIWTNQIELSKEQNAYLDSLKTRCIYIKLVEFKKDEIIRSKVINPYDNQINIIPVVRLDNYFLANPNYTNAEKCEKIYQEVQQQILSFGTKKITSIQLDCDYQTNYTKAYQNIISSLKINYNLNIQITLNVYRTADLSSIPKADNYFIMLYDFYSDKKIYIHNFEILASYKSQLKSFPYQHQFVLPIFSRWVVYENGEVHLNYQLREEQLKNNSNIEYTGKGIYVAKKDLVIDNQIIPKDATINIQESTLDDLKKYQNFICEISPNQSNQLLLFSLGKKTATEFPANALLDLK